MKAVVISRSDRVGDVIVTTACIPLVRQLHPDTPIYLVARSIMRHLFSGEGSVDGFLGYDGAGDQERLRQQLSELDASVIYHFHPDAIVQGAAEQAGIPKRVGFTLDGNTEGLTVAFPYQKSEGAMHEAAYCRQLLCDASEVNLDSVRQSCLAPDPAARGRLKEKAPWLDESEVRIVVNPTAARLVLRWPPAKFKELIRRLAQPGRRIVLAGHPSDDPALIYLREKIQGVAGSWSDLSGQLDLAESAWLFESSDLHISRDTGTSHLAAAMHCHTLTIFARLEPEYGPTRWRPLGDEGKLITSVTGKRWWETRRQFWKRSFRSIEVPQVLQAAESILKAR